MLREYKAPAWWDAHLPTLQWGPVYTIETDTIETDTIGTDVPEPVCSGHFPDPA